MDKRFVFVREDRPAEEWVARFQAGRDEARRWYLGARTAAVPAGTDVGWRHAGQESPTVAECRSALVRHMPELVEGYDEACELAARDDLDRRILSHYRPAPEAAGCTIAVWTGDGGSALVRNYDFPPATVSGRFELTDWSGNRRVIGTAQRPWGGMLDGMNDAGLVVAITFGGSPAQGCGFAVILMVRYLLETCARVAEAAEALCRLPIAQSHNVMLLDRDGDHATVYLGPDREPAIVAARVTANHQDTVVWPELAARNLTVERQALAQRALDDPATTLDGLTALFLESPLYSRSASPTAYTAVYRPAEGRVDYLWPGKVVRQGFARFEEGQHVHGFSN